MEYDPAGNLGPITDADGYSPTLEYDVRSAGRQGPENPAHLATFPQFE